MNRFRMFIDDTGNVHSRTNNHPQNRYAGIVGIIMDLNYLRDTFEPSFRKLKERYFGVDKSGNAPILHLRKMKKAEAVFTHLEHKCCRENWESACMSMYQRAQFTVISVSVDKIEFYAQHPNYSRGIYSLIVGNAIERYFYFLRSQNGQGDVVAEATNSALDKELKDLFSNFYQNGTDHIKGEKLRERMTSRQIKIFPKSSNVAGLQLADLLAATCFSHRKKIYAAGPDFDVFAMKVASLIEQQKFYRSANGNPHGYGRVWRP